MRTSLIQTPKITALEVISVKNLVKKIMMPVAGSMLLMANPSFAQYGGEGGGGAPGGGASSGGSTGSTEFVSYVDVLFLTQFNQDDDVQTVSEPGGLLGGGSSTTFDPVLDRAHGISVLAGFRRKGWYGFELGFSYAKDGEDADVQKQGIDFNTLLYPFNDSNLYFKIAMGATRYVEYPLTQTPDAFEDSDDDFITVNYGGGVGYVLPLQLGETEFGIRAEAVYLIKDRFLERENDFEADINAPGQFEEVQFNVGIRFPL
ncbi:hypothetical protein IMCC21906_00217 [Spongiibacter sp. IMCC21906]|nr:hypothetical protein IMCC21906_00217 [Spongiibacter sp. IMCC21906]